ncbi:MAG: helix-turn-helix domain-containing protein [Chloroflexota bacterium]
MIKHQTQTDHQERITKVLEFVIESHQNQLSLSDLAEVAAQSPFHFERVFQAQTGRTAMQHLKQFRLVQAAIQLRLTDRKILEIALDTGYANPESFSRAFRQHFDESPRQYRKRLSASSMQTKGFVMSNFTIGLVKIPVTNFEAATHYYREVIGLEEEFAVEAYGWAQYKTNNLPLCLYVTGQGGGEGKPGEEVGFHLAVDNIETVYTYIEKRGGQFATEIVSSADGGKFFVLRDPDGNTFKVLQRVIG